MVPSKAGGQTTTAVWAAAVLAGLGSEVKDRNRVTGFAGGPKVLATSAIAPVKAIELSGESPDRGIRCRPVALGNCVFNRKGVQYREVKIGNDLISQTAKSVTDTFFGRLNCCPLFFASSFLRRSAKPDLLLSHLVDGFRQQKLGAGETEVVAGVGSRRDAE